MKMLCILIVTVFGGQLGFAQDPVMDVADEVVPSATFNSSEDITRTFGKADRSQLREMTCGSDPEVAVAAAWILHKLTYDERARYISSSEFCGFLEGRARVSVPNWWKSTLIEYRLIGPIIQNGGLPDGFDRIDGVVRKNGMIIRFHEESKIELQQNDKTWQFCQSEYYALPKDQIGFVVSDIAENGKLVVCVTNEDCDNIEAVCLDKGGDIAWRQVLEEDWSIGSHGSTGISYDFDFVEVVACEDRVAVFSVKSLSHNCQVFDLNSGKCLIRFDTFIGWNLDILEQPDRKSGQGGLEAAFGAPVPSRKWGEGAINRFAWVIVGLVCLGIGAIVAVNIWQDRAAKQPPKMNPEIAKIVKPAPPDPPKKDPVPEDYLNVGGVYGPKAEIEPNSKADLSTLEKQVGLNPGKVPSFDENANAKTKSISFRFSIRGLAFATILIAFSGGLICNWITLSEAQRWEGRARALQNVLEKEEFEIQWDTEHESMTYGRGGVLWGGMSTSPVKVE